MFRSFLYTLLVTSSVACLASPSAHAAVIISIVGDSVPPGTTATVGVFAASDAGDVISGFNLPMDLNNDGKADLPTGFTLGAPILSNVLYTNTGFDTPPSITPANVDAIPTGSGPNVTLSTVPTKLFDLSIVVGASVPVGTILPLQIVVPAQPLQSLFNVAGPNSPVVTAPVLGVPVHGAVTVIPEPTTGLLSCLACGMLLAIRRRSR